jgi:hypothetical protein
MTDQKSKWHETRKARLDELFKGKKFEIREEFKVDEPVATPLGYKIKTGYRIVEVGKLTRDYVEYYVGKSLLDILVEEYAAVEKPQPRRRGRPRKQPIEQAEDWASRDTPDDAQQITQPGEPLINPNADEEYKG